MKKSIALIICCLMLVTCSLAGCSSFSINYVAYYNAVVATVGDTEITRFDLLNAYSSYGYSYYVSTYGYETDEALSMTLDLLIDREVLYQYAMSNSEYALADYQVNAIVEELFDSVDEQMEDYISDALAIINPSLIKDDADEDDDEDDDAYLYSDYVYTKRAQLVEDGNGGYKIQYISNTDTSYTAVIDKSYYQNYLADGKVEPIVEAIVDAYFVQFKTQLTIDYGDYADAIYTKVRALLADDLISYEYYLRDENGNKYSTKTSELIYRYFERNFASQIKSEYLENIRIYFLENEDLNISELISAYQYLVEVDYKKYENHESSYISTMTDIGTDGDSVLYHNTNLSDGTEFGYFIHCLISFTDEQTSALEAIEATEGTNSAKYTSLYNTIVLGNLSQIDSTYDNVLIYARDSKTGLVSENGYTISQVIAEYNEIANSNANYATKLEDFIEFMFKYTGDTSTLEAGMPYVVGTNGNSAMEDAFTEEAITLMSTGVAGTMSSAVNLSSDSFDASSLCITSYGIHFLFYVGGVDAFDVNYTDREAVYISLLSSSSDPNGNLNLYYKEINPLTHETYFDYLFDIVFPENSTDGETYTSNTGYSNYETNLINEAKSTICEVKTYKDRIKSTSVS